MEEIVKWQWPPDKHVLEELYCVRKMSGEQIAALCGVKSGTVSYWRKKYGIKKIECWERRPEILLSETEKDIILGHLLGDGHLAIKGNYANLRVSQSNKQVEFVRQLHVLLHRWAAYEPKVDKYFSPCHRKIYETCRFDTIAHPEFNKLYNMCYKNGTKTIDENWLNLVGGKGVAMWYQGDGQLCSGVTPKINTNSFSETEHDIIIHWLKNRFGVTSYKRKEGRFWKVVITSGMVFRDVVERHMHPFFAYKLPNPRMRRTYRKTIARRDDE
jgi:hypothetical protein